MSDRTEALALLQDGTFAIRESTLNAWCRALSATTTAVPQVARQSTSARRTPSGTIGTFGLMGPVVHPPNVLSYLFGGTSILEARRALSKLVDERSVETIVIEFDTPGGDVDSLIEFAAEIRAARQKKPILGFINTQCCSAGYWLGAQCSELVATPSGETGSVGVFGVHSDFSQMNERIGYRPTYIAAPRYKAEGNADMPLSDETRKYLQAGIDRVLF